MTQVPGFEATATARDITHRLGSGCYVAQVRGPADRALGVIYATAAAPPEDLDTWYQADAGESFRFAVAPDSSPVWVRTNPSLPERITVPVALARTGA